MSKLNTLSLLQGLLICSSLVVLVAAIPRVVDASAYKAADPLTTVEEETEYEMPTGKAAAVMKSWCADLWLTNAYCACLYTEVSDSLSQVEIEELADRSFDGLSDSAVYAKASSNCVEI